MASCKCLGKTSGVLLLSAVLLVVAACTPVSAATTNTGDVLVNAATRKPLNITTYYEELQEKPEHSAKKRKSSDSCIVDVKYSYCSTTDDVVVDRRTGVDVNCTDRDIINWILRSMIEVGVMNAVELHSARLSVLNPDKEVKFPDDDVLCTHFAFEKERIAVPGTDFLLFVAGAPMTAGDTQAWGTWCGTKKQTTRPVAGAINVAPMHILKSVMLMTRLVAREILVALGFGYYTLSAHMTTADIRGTKGVPVAKAPTALKKAQAHFGCDDMKHMELEYKSNDKTPLPYWRSRVMKDDLMALNQIAGSYTDITLAAMADLGFYAVDYTKAEGMQWGRGAGCDFVNKKCVSGGTSSFAKMFCTRRATYPPMLTCTTDRYALGACDLTAYPEDLPESFQYFADKPNEGGAQFAMDYCPVIVPMHADHYCSLGLGGGVKNFVFSDTSRCLDISTSIPFGTNMNARGVCVAVQCDDKAKTYKVSFDRENYIECADDKKIDVPNSVANGKGTAATSKATCLPYIEVCGTSKFDPEAKPGPKPQPHHSDSSHHSSHHSSYHSGSMHHNSHHDSALTVVQSVWGVTLSLAMVLFMIM